MATFNTQRVKNSNDEIKVAKMAIQLPRFVVFIPGSLCTHKLRIVSIELTSPLSAQIAGMNARPQQNKKTKLT